MAGAGRIVRNSNAFARLAAPDHRSGHVVMTHTRNTIGESNNYGAQAGRARPYMLEPPMALHDHAWNIGNTLKFQHILGIIRRAPPGKGFEFSGRPERGSGALGEPKPWCQIVPKRILN